MAIELIDKIKPKNNGRFPLMDAQDVEYAGKRLTEYLDGIPETVPEDDGKIMQVVNGILTAVPVGESSVKIFVEEYIQSALEGDY